MRILTNNFHVNIAKEFKDSFDDKDNMHYMTFHKSIPYINESLVPDFSTDIYTTHYNMYDTMVFGKGITSNDVSLMIRHIPWVYGDVYASYDDKDENLFDKNFYVVVEELDEYHVFKCLDNANGSPSEYSPKRSEIQLDDDMYGTADGYQWKFMYTISPSVWKKFSTPKYIPIIEDPLVSSYAVDGSIDSVRIDDPGRSYYSYGFGKFSEIRVGGNNMIFSLESSDMVLSTNASFYDNCSLYISNGTGNGQIKTILNYFISGNTRRVLLDSPFNITPDTGSSFVIAPRVIISGDGAGAKAKCDVNLDDGSIENVMVIDRGKGYTHADIRVVGNTGSISVSSTSSARITPIISPPGGHGSNPYEELKSDKVAMSINLIGDEGGKIPVENDYRMLGVVKNPTFSNVKLDLDSSAAASGFVLGSEVIQESTRARGIITGLSGNTVTMTQVHSMFETTSADPDSVLLNPITGISKNISIVDQSYHVFDNRYIFDVDIIDNGPTGSGFIEDELVVQEGLFTIGTNDYIQLILENENDAYQFEDGEIINHVNGAGTNVSAKITNRIDNVLTVVGATDFFTVENNIVGSTSGSVVKLIDFDNTFNANGSGYIHEIIKTGGIVTGIALTGVLGNFQISDLSTNTEHTFIGKDSRAVAKLNAINTNNTLVDNSGSFLYIENFLAVERDISQTEDIRIIIDF